MTRHWYWSSLMALVYVAQAANSDSIMAQVNPGHTWIAAGAQLEQSGIAHQDFGRLDQVGTSLGILQAEALVVLRKATLSSTATHEWLSPTKGRLTIASRLDVPRTRNDLVAGIQPAPAPPDHQPVAFEKHFSLAGPSSIVLTVAGGPDLGSAGSPTYHAWLDSLGRIPGINAEHERTVFTADLPAGEHTLQLVNRTKFSTTEPGPLTSQNLDALGWSIGGGSQDDPLVPDVVSPTEQSKFADVISGAWIDVGNSKMATGFHFQTTSGGEFTRILGFPEDLKVPLTVRVGPKVLGEFESGDTVNFVSRLGKAVDGFTIGGLDRLDDLTSFPLQVEFDGLFADMSIEPTACDFDGKSGCSMFASVPEPGSLGLVMAMLGAICLRTRNAPACGASRFVK